MASATILAIWDRDMRAPATKPSMSPYVSIHIHSSQILYWRVVETKTKKDLKI